MTKISTLMARKNYYFNVYVPNCTDLVNMGLTKSPFALDETVDYGKCLLSEENNEAQLYEDRLMCAEIRFKVLQFYKNSQSFLWHPTKDDEVFWVTFPDQAAILQPRVKNSTDAADQYNYVGNCYRSRKEAETLLEIILFVLKKYKKLP